VAEIQNNVFKVLIFMANVTILVTRDVEIGNVIYIAIIANMDLYYNHNLITSYIS
jgi:hypothetical protein